MKTFARVCTALLLMMSSALYGSQDLFAPPTSSHTRFDLPEPYKHGEIAATGALKEFRQGESMMEILSLKVTIGATEIDVPRPMLALFPGANLATLRFLVGPPDSPEFPLYSENPKPGEPAYFVVTFLCHAWPHDPGVNADNGTTAVIVLKDSKVIRLYLSQYEDKGSTGTYHSTEYDPATLKEIPRPATGKAPEKTETGEKAKP
jgi:hypothetical protein